MYRGWNHRWYDHYPLHVTFAAVFFIGAYPAVLGLLIGIALQKDWAGKLASQSWINWLLTKTHLKTFRAHRIPTAWEAVFSSKLDSCWVVVTRKNGEQVRGLLGPESHISIDPEVRDLFISHTLYLNSDTQNYEFVPGTKGIYLKADEISTIHLRLPTMSTKPITPHSPRLKFSPPSPALVGFSRRRFSLGAS